MVFSFRFWWFRNSKHTEGVPMAQLFATGIYTTIWTLPLFNTPDYIVTVVTRSITEYQELYDDTLSRLPGVLRLNSTIVMKDVIPGRGLPL